MTRNLRLADTTALIALPALALPAVAADEDLLILDWSGHEEDAHWEHYAEQHGDMPTHTFFGDEEEAFQKLRSGFRADVAHPCPQSVEKWREAGLIEPWDVSLIPSYGTVPEEYRTHPNVVVGGAVRFIPADLGATAIAWNTEEVPAWDVDALQVFTDPAYRGRTSLPDVVDDAHALAYLATGVTDWTKATQENFEAASAWLREVSPNVRTCWTDGAELAQPMGTGEVLIAWPWNETPLQLATERSPIAFRREAEEGSSLCFWGYVDIADGPCSRAKAHDFVDSYVQTGAAEYIVNEWGYGHSSSDAMSAIDRETLDEAGRGPVEAPVLNEVPTGIALREQMIEAFERIKAGV